MEKTDPKTIEIPLYFHNYKLLEDKRFLLKGSAIYFVQGPNRVGKTSFLNALAAIQGAKETTKEPVTRGKEEGYNEFVIPGADGKSYTIKHSFDNEKNRFIAIDDEGNKISNVTDIRKIFNYTHFTVGDWFRLSATEKGRRQQKEILLKLLSDTEKAKYGELEDLEDVKYIARTSINRNKEVQEATLKNSSITDEELKSLENLDKIEKDLAKYSAHDTRLQLLDKNITVADTTINKLTDTIAQIKSNLEAHELELANEQKTLTEDLLSVYEIEKELEIKLTVVNEETGNAVIQTEEFDELCTQLNADVTSIQGIVYKRDQHNETETKLKETNASWTMLDEEIKGIREAKAKIISKSKLPLDNISFEDGYLTVDGFTFTEDQVCESDGILLVAKIMSEINPGPVQLIGDASVLDFNRLEELNKIAEDKGKVLFVDEVVRDLKDIRVVGYEDIKGDMKAVSIKSKTGVKATAPISKVVVKEEGKDHVTIGGKSKDKTEINIVNPVENVPPQSKEVEKENKPKEDNDRNAGKIFKEAKEKHRQSLGHAIKETDEFLENEEKKRENNKADNTEKTETKEEDLF